MCRRVEGGGVTGGWTERRNDGQLSGVIGEQQCMCWLQIDVGAGTSPKAVNMLSGSREINSGSLVTSRLQRQL